MAAVIVRALTALLGGYAAAALIAALVVRLLPVMRVEAAAWGLVLSFGLYAAILLWVYAQPRLARAAIGVWGGVGLLTGVALVLGIRP